VGIVGAGPRADARPDWAQRFVAAAGFAYGLRRARLQQILCDPQFSRFFAHAHVGVDA
jgi:hypothetical protein